MTVDDTHRADLVSWVESAQAPASDFPIQNLPFAIFRRPSDSHSRIGIGIGDQILDVAACVQDHLLEADAIEAAQACGVPFLNQLMSLGRGPARALRRSVSAMLRADSPDRKRAERMSDEILAPMADVELQRPEEIGDYTDFYASIYHATNVGSMFRPENPLLPNYKWIPIGYHGRASSILPSGTPVQRPSGQLRNNPDEPPRFAPTQRLDYELEIGAYVGKGNDIGNPISVEKAESHIFGLTLVNDWSARDIQTWEYQPLGPFLAKSFATTVSPWIVTLDALEPFRIPVPPRADGDPAPLPYLFAQGDQERGSFDITLEVYLTTERMRSDRHAPFLVSRGRFADMYWTFAQFVAHHTSNGCNLRPCDLIASGTVSGPSDESRGCLLERTWRGTKPLRLPTGETRTFLENGDEVSFRGYCQRDGFARIGFGECRGVVVGGQEDRRTGGQEDRRTG
jgi:fumarylacetoacetase